MVNARLLRLAAAVVGLSMCTAAQADPLSPEARREDPRLETPVTVREPAILVGDLLERLSKASGVRVAPASPDDGAADELLLVSLRDTPLGDVMEALWSLFSYRGAGWHWSRSGEPGKYEYALSRPQAARTLPARIREEAQQRFEASTEIAIAAACAPAEERRQFADRLGQALGIPGDPQVADLLEETRGSAGRRMLGEQLTAQERAEVMRGVRDITIPVSAMSDAGREFVRSTFASGNWMRVAPDGTRSPAPEPTFVTVMARPSGIADEPCLYVQLEHVGGYGYAGGTPLKRGLARIATSLWRLPGDSATDPREAEMAPVPREAPSKKPTPADHVLALADAANLSILMRRPWPYDTDRGALLGMTVAKALETLVSDPPPDFAHKWRAGVLLIESMGWYHKEAGNVRWRAVKRLRDAADRGDGWVGLPDLVEAAADMEPAQVHRYEDMLPAANALEALHPLLRMCRGSRTRAARLLGKSGAPIDDSIDPWVRGHAGDRFGAARSIRVVEATRAHATPLRTLTVEVLTAGAEWIPLVGFSYGKWPTGALTISEGVPAGPDPRRTRPL